MQPNCDFLPIAQALREWLPPGRSGAPTNPATAWRWATKGARTLGGGRAFLRLTKVGGRLFLERRALDEFARACSARPEATAPAALTPATATAETLERAGIRRPAKAGK